MLQSITRFAVAPALLLAMASNAQDAYLNTSFVPRYWKANEAWPISARVRNFSSSTPLITFRVDWRFNNGPVQVGNTQSTTGILPGQYWPYTHPTAFNQPASGGMLKVWVVGQGDSNHANDTLYFPVDVLSAWAAKSVFIEQYTGTWCQFCPAANAATNTLDLDPLVVVAKHHNGDELSSATSTDYWAQFNANYSPSGVMDQEEFGSLQDNANYDQWGSWADLRKQGVSPVAVTLNAEFNDWQRDLSVQVDAAFAASVTGQFTVNAFLVEDQVPGAQTAAPSGYIHQQVVRHVFGGASGTSGVIPAATVAGSTYSHTYTLSVPVQWNSENLRVIAFVTELRNGLSWTMNVTDGDLVSVGVDERDEAFFSAGPNPSNGEAWLRVPGLTGAAMVELLAADGRLMGTERIVASEAPVSIDLLRGLADGAYILQVRAGDRQGQLRMMVRK